MKRVIKLIVILILVTSIVSCAQNSTIMKYGNTSLSERMYNYWFLQYKAYFFNSMSADGIAAYEDYLMEIIDLSIKKNLICIDLFDANKLKIPKDVLDSIDEEINELIASYGSRSELNKYLGQYGINDKIYKESLIIQEKIAVLYQYLYGNGGMLQLTNDEIENYYKEHYTRVKYVLLVLFDVDEMGNQIEYDDEQISEVRKTADLIENELKNGADIDGLIAEYSYDDMNDYKNGVYISTNDFGKHTVINEALDMEIGEIKIIDLKDEYAIYIVKKLELETKPYLNDSSGQFDTLIDYCADDSFQTLLNQLADDVTVVDSIKDKYTLR
ncbi:MAG: hypothetical protein FWF15_10565 [Oscillospiraceae bacterium]|nr:hypothetical protein [Oscillospiraceae bacterium]